ncbi:MAG: hypothetical protein V4534_04050 [Myxococcota bacterium]
MNLFYTLIVLSAFAIAGCTEKQPTEKNLEPSSSHLEPVIESDPPPPNVQQPPPQSRRPVNHPVTPWPPSQPPSLQPSNPSVNHSVTPWHQPVNEPVMPASIPQKRNLSENLQGKWQQHCTQLVYASDGQNYLSTKSRIEFPQSAKLVYVFNLYTDNKCEQIGLPTLEYKCDFQVDGGIILPKNCRVFFTDKEGARSAEVVGVAIQVSLDHSKLTLLFPEDEPSVDSITWANQRKKVYFKVLK